MMRRFAAFALAVLLLATCVPAMAATTGRVTESRIATRSGPSTRYTEPGTFLSRGDSVLIHTKVWDSRNEIYWVQVEFTYRGEGYRVYTGSWRLNADLNSVPYETVEGYSWLNYSLHGYAGPGYDYHRYGGITLYGNSDCTIVEVENNFALIETSGSSKGLTRAWVPLDALASGYAYYGHDTFSGGSAWDDGPTLLPGYDYDDGYGWQEQYTINPVGQYVTVWVDSGHARSGPGTNYDFLNYVHQGDVLQVLDWEMGNTGKDWYQVRINGRKCWISSGLVTIQGYSDGTAYGVPIILDDPLEDYPQTSTHLIGRWIRVNASSAHVRQEPHTDTQTVAYVKQNQCYEILDSRTGNTGKAWYLIEVEGTQGWISSGIVTLLGY